VFTGQNFVWLYVKCSRDLFLFLVGQTPWALTHCQFPFLANEKLVATLTNFFCSIDASAILYIFFSINGLHSFT